MTAPPLNISYWAMLYDWFEDNDAPYQDALGEPEFLDRAEQLWSWKGLSRSLDFATVSSELTQVDIQSYVNQPQGQAVRQLREELQRRGVIGGKGIVTPAFLLHLADSGPDGYSVQFPIYDRRVWNAYVYLWGIRDAGDRLYRAASLSPEQYADFCQDFASSCPDDTDPRRYEQALFMFGGFIMDLSTSTKATRIETIDRTVSAQEEAIRQMQDNTEFALVNQPRRIDEDEEYSESRSC